MEKKSCPVESFRRYLSLPLYDGRRVSFDISEKGEVLTVKKADVVTVPAGTFKDCLEYSVETETDKYTRWFSANVGLIKEHYYYKNGTLDVVYELEEYHIVR